MIFKSYSIENDRAFAAILEKTSNKVGDLRIEFGIIAKDWRKANRAQFTLSTLKGSGKYPPLNPEYQRRKTKLAGRRLPILVGAKKGGGESGRLRDSLIDRGTKDSILVIGKKSMIMGTRVPHGIFHQSDEPRSKIPLRKFLFIDNAMVKRWTGTLEAAAARKVK